MRLPPGTKRLVSKRELEAVTSPVRQEVLEQLDHRGPASVAELARRTGRRTTALHYHVKLLHRAGLLRLAGRRPSGSRTEALYALAAPRFAVAGAAASPAVLRSAVRTIGASLRLAQREAAAAILSGDVGAFGRARAFHSRRHRGSLSAAALARVNRLLDEIASLFEAENRRSASASEVFAVTFVLSPSGRRSGHSSEVSR